MRSEVLVENSLMKQPARHFEGQQEPTRRYTELCRVLPQSSIKQIRAKDSEHLRRSRACSDFSHDLPRRTRGTLPRHEKPRCSPARRVAGKPRGAPGEAGRGGASLGGAARPPTHPPTHPPSAGAAGLGRAAAGGRQGPPRGCGQREPPEEPEPEPEPCGGRAGCPQCAAAPLPPAGAPGAGAARR